MSTNNSPVTNLIGTILMIISVGMYVIPYFFNLKQEINDWVIGGIGVIGLLLILGVSDDLAKIILGWIKSKLGIKDGDKSQE